MNDYANAQSLLHCFSYAFLRVSLPSVYCPGISFQSPGLPCIRQVALHKTPRPHLNEPILITHFKAHSSRQGE